MDTWAGAVIPQPSKPLYVITCEPLLTIDYTKHSLLDQSNLLMHHHKFFFFFFINERSLLTISPKMFIISLPDGSLCSIWKGITLPTFVSNNLSTKPRTLSFIMRSYPWPVNHPAQNEMYHDY